MQIDVPLNLQDPDVLRALACFLDELADLREGKPSAIDLDVPSLPPMALDCLEAATTTEWISSLNLSLKAGYAYGGRWRSNVALLVKAGLLERDQRTKKLRRTNLP